MTTPNTQSFVYRSKCNQKPFSFRWEVEHLPFRLRSVGSQFSPVFEVAPGVLIFVRLDRAKVDDEEWFATYLSISPKSPVKEVSLSYFSITLLRTPPNQNLRLESKVMKQFALAAPNRAEQSTWGWNKPLRFADLVNPAQGYLKDGHQLTILAEGSVFSGEQLDEREIVLTPEGAPVANMDLDGSFRSQGNENFRKVFDFGMFTDFVVKARDANGVEKELKVHKDVLAAGSGVFLAMLSKPTVKESCEGQVKIEDIPFEVMEALIRFIYTGELQLESAEGYDVELLVAADKYQIKELKKLLERRLTASLSTENACGVLAYAHRHKAPFLRARCIEFIRQRRDQVTRSRGWRRLCAPEYHKLMGAMFRNDPVDDEHEDFEGEENGGEVIRIDSESDEGEGEETRQQQPSSSSTSRPKKRCRRRN